MSAHTRAQKWSLRDTLPLFSQAQVVNLIGHLCYLILQSLRADRGRDDKRRRFKGWNRNCSVWLLSRDTEPKQAQACMWYLCDIWPVTSSDALIWASAEFITHPRLFQLHLADQHNHTNASHWRNETSKNTQKCSRDSLPPSVRLLLSTSYVEQPPSAKKTSLGAVAPALGSGPTTRLSFPLPCADLDLSAHSPLTPCLVCSSVTLETGVRRIKDFDWLSRADQRQRRTERRETDGETLSAAEKIMDWGNNRRETEVDMATVSD